jgi:hypothetical protein
MQILKTSESEGKVVFDSSLETVPGGVCVAVTDLNASLTSLAEGTAVGKDSNGLYHVNKCASAHADAANNATDYQVKKGHPFKVGNFLTTGTSLKAYAITAITTTEAAYDTLSVGTSLGVAVTAGDILTEAAAQSTGTTSALKYTPVGLIGAQINITSGDNHTVDVIVRGSVRSGNLPYTHAAIKSALPLIRFVS